MNLNELPFEIIFDLPTYFETCQDVANFRLTCKLFSEVKIQCNHHKISNPWRVWWINNLFNLPPQSRTLIKRVNKVESDDQSLFRSESNTICGVGRSKKMFKYLLNELSLRNHIGGAVFGMNDRFNELVKNYSPSCSFLKDKEQFDFYVETLGRIERTMYKRKTVPDDQKRSYLILFENDNGHFNTPAHRRIMMNSRHYYTDVLMHMDSLLNINPSIKSQIDIYVFKKTKRVSITEVKKIYEFLTHMLVDPQLYEKTFKTNLVLIVDERRDSKLVDISNKLSDCSLSDHIFWHNTHLINN